jgi:lysophospholipase L1-like esterase
MTVAGSGATATSPSITTFGSPILVAWGASDAGGGIATLTIDGTAVDTLTSSGFNGQTIVTQNGTTRSLFLKAYPVSAGTHTVRVTTTNASTFEIAWASAIPLPFTAAHTPISPPRVYVSGVLKQKNDAISAITAAYDGIVRSVVTTFAGYGLNVVYVPSRNFVDAAAEMSDAVHPNDTGHKHLRDAFEAAIQPLVPTPPLLSQVVSLWSGSLQATTISSSFNEGAANATIIGTKPAVDIPNSTWFTIGSGNGGAFNSGGGVTFGPSNLGFQASSALDLAHADATITLTGVQLTGTSGTSLAIDTRTNSAFNSGLVLEWNSGGAVALNDVSTSGTGNVTLATGSVGSTTTGDITFTLSGTAVSVNIFGTVLSGTVPTGSSTLSQSLLVVNPNGAVGFGNTAKAIVAGLSVLSASSSCSGVLKSDGVCTPLTSGYATISAGASTASIAAAAVTANSQISVTFDSSLGSKLGVTCNTVLATPWVSARTPGTGFTLSTGTAPTTNPACYSYTIFN